MRNVSYRLSILLFLLFVTNSIYGQVINCKDLIKYRDVDLPKVLDNQLKKYQINREQVKEITEIKNKLKEDTWKATTNLNLITLTLKTAANAIEDIIGASTPQGYLLKISKESAKRIDYAKVYEAIKKGKSALDLTASNNIERDIALEAFLELTSLSNSLAIVKNLMENLGQMNDYSNVIAEVRKQVSAADKAIADYNKKLASSNLIIDEINQYKNYIDEYLQKNCKPINLK